MYSAFAVQARQVIRVQVVGAPLCFMHSAFAVQARRVIRIQVVGAPLCFMYSAFAVQARQGDPGPGRWCSTLL
jgi:hypothetical protein